MQFRTLTACALILAALSLGFSRTSHADPLKVKTEQGKIQGKAINSGKVNAFLGLPYAAPPVGDLRWKAPNPQPNGRERAMRLNSVHIVRKAACLTT